MSPTELQQLESLLHRALPDPRGFADRVLEQLLDRLSTDSPLTRPVTVVQQQAPAGPSDHEVLLAAALGACECWGQDSECGLCGGAGTPGWTTPDQQLFEEYVMPAVRRSWETAGPNQRTDSTVPQEGAEP